MSFQAVEWCILVQMEAVIYLLHRLQCELCESLLPQKITIGNRGYSFDVIQRPNCPYLIMQSTSRDKKDKKSGKAVYVMQFQGDEPIKMVFFTTQQQGRGHQCDIRISDISVSRLHAYIKYEDGNFVIVDNNSKFGTLVKLSKPFKIEQEKRNMNFVVHSLRKNNDAASLVSHIATGQGRRINEKKKKKQKL